MSDLDTSMMLLLAKASRKIHKNSLDGDLLRGWLLDCIERCEQAARPYWFMLAAEPLSETRTPIRPMSGRSSRTHEAGSTSTKWRSRSAQTTSPTGLGPLERD